MLPPEDVWRTNHSPRITPARLLVIYSGTNKQCISITVIFVYNGNYRPVISSLQFNFLVTENFVGLRRHLKRYRQILPNLIFKSLIREIDVAALKHETRIKAHSEPA